MDIGGWSYTPAPAGVNSFTVEETGAFIRLIDHPTDPDLVTVESGHYGQVEYHSVSLRAEVLAVLQKDRDQERLVNEVRVKFRGVTT